MIKSPWRLLKAGQVAVMGPATGGVHAAGSSTPTVTGGTATGMAADAPSDPRLGDAGTRAAALERRAASLLVEAEAAVQAMQTDAARAAGELAAAAQAEAERVLAAAEAAGFAQGRSAGYLEGSQAAAAEAEQVLAAARARADELLAAAQAEALQVRQDAARDRQRLLAGVEPDLARLALSIARKILHTELVVSRDAVVLMVGTALAGLRGESGVKVRLAAEDLIHAEGRRSELVSALGGQDVELVADATLDRGDFVIQSPQGVVDGRIQRQLAELEAALVPGAVDAWQAAAAAVDPLAESEPDGNSAAAEAGREAGADGPGTEEG